MPKRVIDFEAMWASDKLSRCAEWAQAEYAWLYGLADANGSFELTNLRVIWGRVAAIRRNLSLARLEQIFDEFQDKGLLFVWEQSGKRYGHWTGSDVPGRLPPPSWRNRLERLAPPVPSERLAAYAHGCAVPGTRDASAGGSPPTFAPSGPLNPRLEAPPAQDWEREGDEEREVSCPSSRKGGTSDTRAPESLPATCAEAVQDLPANSVEAAAQVFRRGAGVAPASTGRGESLSDRQNAVAEVQAGGHAESPFQDSGEFPAEPESRESGTTKTANGKPDPRMLLEIYEQERGGLPPVRELTPQRLGKCRARLGAKRGAEALFLEDFRAAVRRASATPFLCGASERGWKANFDWFIGNDTNYLKVLEGRYDAQSDRGLDVLQALPGLRDPAGSSGTAANSRDGGGAQREALVGRGPQGPVCVRAEALERFRQREAASRKFFRDSANPPVPPEPRQISGTAEQEASTPGQQSKIPALSGRTPVRVDAERVSREGVPTNTHGLDSGHARLRKPGG